MNPDGSGQQNLTNHPACDGGPAWSADGEKIAFVSDRSGRSQIWIMDEDGSNQTQVTNDPATAFGPSWSPDGTWIAFTSTRNGGSNSYDIFKIHPDGTGETPLATTPEVQESAPAWAPDNSKIVYNRHTYFANNDLFTMNPDGSGQTLLAPSLLPQGVQRSAPSWSPDAQRVVFQGDRPGQGYQIFATNADGSGGGTELTAGEPSFSNFNPAASPDGSKIVFNSSRDGNPEIYVMNANGSAQTRITFVGASDSDPDWQPQVVAAPAASLSPSSLDFGDQLLGTTSPPATVTLTNTGTATLLFAIGGISPGGEFFISGGACLFTGSLAPGGSCTIDLVFQPGAPGARGADLVITDNAPGSPHTVPLTGTGVTPGPAADFSPGSVAFGDQLVGTQSPPTTVTLTNTGTATLLFAIGGISPGGDFFITGGTCLFTGSLAPGAGCSIDLVFGPAASGARGANLVITDNAPGNPHMVPLAGNGLSAAPVAMFTASPNPAACQQPITFDGSASWHPNPARTIVAYDWEFGDGATGSGVQASHAYGAAADYTVRLTVTDDNAPRLQGTASMVVHVQVVNNAPVASAGGPYTIAQGSELHLDGSGSTDPNASCGDSIVYAWDLNLDGVTDATGPQPTVSAAGLDSLGVGQPGVYPIKLHVTDSFGARATASTTLTIVGNAAPRANAGGPYDIDEGDGLSLDGSASFDPDEDALTYSWDVNGDGIFGDASGVSPTLSWNDLGALGIDDGPAVFSVMVEVSDGTVADLSVATLSLYNKAPAATIVGPAGGVPGSSATFTLGATDASPDDQAGTFTYRIDWNGDGVVDQTVTGDDSEDVGHAWGWAGSFTIMATASDKDSGESAQETHGVTVAPCAEIESALAINVPAGGSVSIVRSGTGIVVTGAGTCFGAPTVSSVDTIDVVGAAGDEEVTIDLSGGQFAPGASTESSSTSEVEWTVDLGAGSDELVIVGSDGADSVRLGSAGINLNNDNDADVTVAGVELVTVNGGTGADVVTGIGAFGNDPGKWAGVLHLNGEGGKDKLTGGLADDVLDGGLGADTLEAIKLADGADVFIGGAGTDTISYGPRLGGVSVTVDGLANDGTPGEGDDVREVETLIGGKGNDLLDAGELSVKNTLRGGAGDDDLFGGPNADALLGEVGADHLFGEAGKDTLNAQDGVLGNDTLDGGSEYDTCKPDAGDTVLNCEA